jgi:hypothetical protein
MRGKCEKKLSIFVIYLIIILPMGLHNISADDDAGGGAIADWPAKRFLSFYQK